VLAELVEPIEECRITQSLMPNGQLQTLQEAHRHVVIAFGQIAGLNGVMSLSGSTRIRGSSFFGRRGTMYLSKPGNKGCSRSLINGFARIGPHCIRVMYHASPQ
jgi:hypothetical protein